MVLRVKPAPTRFPTNRLYISVDNTPLHQVGYFADVGKMKFRELSCTIIVPGCFFYIYLVTGLQLPHLEEVMFHNH